MYRLIVFRKMKNILKKAAIVAFAVCVCFVPTNAQEKGDMAMDATILFGYGNDIIEVGLGAKFLYNVSDPLRLAGEFDILWGISPEKITGKGLIPNTVKTTTTWKEFSMYGHYLFKYIYPLVGIGFVNLKTQTELKGLRVNEKVLTNESKFMFTLGGGIEYDINEKISYNVELRIKIADVGTRLHSTIGITYKF